VLRAAALELSSVKSATQQEGWNSSLAGRAASALRLAGAVALGRSVSQHEVPRGTAATEGQIAVRRGLRGKKIVLSSAVTAGTPNENGATASRSAIWDGISQTLGAFTAVRYSRNGTPDGTALDAALAEGQDLVRQLWRHQLVRLRLGKTKPHPSEIAKQTWAR
jgi:hypothetical protein